MLCRSASGATALPAPGRSRATSRNAPSWRVATSRASRSGRRTRKRRRARRCSCLRPSRRTSSPVAPAETSTNARLLHRRGRSRPPLLALPRRPLSRDARAALVRARPLRMTASPRLLLPPAREASGGEGRLGQSSSGVGGASPRRFVDDQARVQMGALAQPPRRSRRLPASPSPPPPLPPPATRLRRAGGGRSEKPSRVAPPPPCGEDRLGRRPSEKGVAGHGAPCRRGTQVCQPQGQGPRDPSGPALAADARRADFDREPYARRPPPRSAFGRVGPPPQGGRGIARPLCENPLGKWGEAKGQP